MRERIPLGRPRGSGTDELQPAAFRDALAELKAGGCNLLVTGEVGADVTDAMSGRLLGASDQSRKRVVVLADRTAEDADRVLPEGVSPDDPDVAVVDHSLSTRGATAAGSNAAPTPRPDPHDGDAASSERLRREVATTLVDIETAAGGFDPAELRLSLVTLQPLVDRDGVDAVERLVRGVRAHVAGVSGMAHYHLPVADDAAAVERLAPLFDARIELRVESGLGPEQRWHLPDRGTSPWIGL